MSGPAPGRADGVGSAGHRLGFDIGGTKVLAGVVDPTGRLVASQRRGAPVELSADLAFDTLVELAGDLVVMAEIAAHEVVAVGLGLPGDFEPSSGVLKTIPNLPELVGCVPTEVFARCFARRLGHRPRVAADNDTVVAVLAEACRGAGVGARRVFYLTVSTGVGGARYDGEGCQNVEPGLRLHPDPTQPDRCLEELAGGAALARRLRRQLRARLDEAGEEALIPQRAVLDRLEGQGPLAERLDGLSIRHLGEAVIAGDPWARQILDQAADQVAAGLAELLSQGWGEERIVVGGSIALQVPGYLDRVRATLARHRDRPGAADGLRAFDVEQLVPAGLGEERGILGAVLLTGPI